MANPNSIEGLIARLADGDSLSAEQLGPELDADPMARRILRLARMLDGVRAVAGPQEQPAPAPMPEVDRAGDVLGAWRLLQPIGAGGMGEVWLAERCDGQVEQRVAIKRVRGARSLLVRRMRRERKILARLSHPNIARFIDAGVDGHGVPYLVLEYVAGLPIDRWCAQHASGIADRLRLMIAICDAVDHANRQLVVHRDLKPDNVLVGNDGVPKLLDFGIAKLLESTEGSRTQTAISALTPAYATPEQLAGDEVSTATDVYALGLMLHELLCGELPHGRRALTMAQLATALERGDQDPPSRVLALRTRRLDDAEPWPIAAREIGADLDAIVAKALRAEPHARYRSAGDLADDLRRYLDGQPVQAHGGSRAYRARKFLRRHRIATAAVASATLALIGGLAIALWQAEIARDAARRADAEAVSSERIAVFALLMVREQYAHGRRTTEPQTPQEMLAKNIEWARTKLKDDNRARATILTKLGELQAAIDSPANAEPAVLEALNIYRELYGDSHPETAVAKFSLATVKDQGDQLVEAESLLREALPVFANSPTQHDYLVMSQSRLANILRRTGRIDEAVDLLETARAGFVIEYGADHPNTIELISNRAMLLDRLDRLPEAEAGFRSAIAAYERTSGPDYPRLAHPLANLGLLLSRQGRYAEARTVMERALDIGRRQIGVTDPLVVRFAVYRVELLRTIGDLDAAQRELDAIDAAAFSDRPVDQCRLHRVRGQLLMDRGHYQEGMAELELAARILQGAKGDLTDALLAMDLALADALIVGARWDEATTMQRRARDRVDGHARPLTAYSIELARLEARLAAHAGRVDDAETTLTRALALSTKTTGANTADVARIETELADTLASVPGRTDDAARWRASAQKRIAALGIKPIWAP